MTGDDEDDSVCTESEFESDYKEEDNRDTLPIDQADVLTILAVLGEKPTDERKMWRDFLRTICKDYFNFDENVSSVCINVYICMSVIIYIYIYMYVCMCVFFCNMFVCFNACSYSYSYTRTYTANHYG